MTTTIEQSIDLDVPVRTAYDQWTQFEEFPQFMDGVEEVRQTDDTHLHWIAEVAGQREEWDAEICRSSPTSGSRGRRRPARATRASSRSNPLSDGHTRIMFQPQLGARGHEGEGRRHARPRRRRREGDLERFKEMIEGRGTASEGWRETVSGGVQTNSVARSRRCSKAADPVAANCGPWQMGR